MYAESTEEAIKQCQQLLEEHNIDQSVRVGDIYGFLVEHFVKHDKMKAVGVRLQINMLVIEWIEHC